MIKTNVQQLQLNQPGPVSGERSRLGVYKPGFRYKEASLRYFKECVGDEVFNRAMSSEAGHMHHYAVARAFLQQTDWEKFVWIEEYGSLDGFPG